MEKCPVCEKEFDPITGRRRRKFCSDNCRQKAWQANNKSVPPEGKKEFPPSDAEVKAKTAEKNKKSEAKVAPPSDEEIKLAAAEANRKEIQNKIANIKAEKIPKERDTTIGRKSWALDQKKRIQELEAKLNSKSS